MVKKKNCTKLCKTDSQKSNTTITNKLNVLDYDTQIQIIMDKNIKIIYVDDTIMNNFQNEVIILLDDDVIYINSNAMYFSINISNYGTFLITII